MDPLERAILSHRAVNEVLHFTGQLYFLSSGKLTRLIYSQSLGP